MGNELDMIIMILRQSGIPEDQLEHLSQDVNKKVSSGFDIRSALGMYFTVIMSRIQKHHTLPIDNTSITKYVDKFEQQVLPYLITSQIRLGEES